MAHNGIGFRVSTPKDLGQNFAKKTSEFFRLHSPEKIEELLSYLDYSYFQFQIISILPPKPWLFLKLMLVKHLATGFLINSVFKTLAVKLNFVGWKKSVASLLLETFVKTLCRPVFFC